MLTFSRGKQESLHLRLSRMIDQTVFPSKPSLTSLLWLLTSTGGSHLQSRILTDSHAIVSDGIKGAASQEFPLQLTFCFLVDYISQDHLQLQGGLGRNNSLNFRWGLMIPPSFIYCFYNRLGCHSNTLIISSQGYQANLVFASRHPHVISRGKNATQQVE